VELGDGLGDLGHAEHRARRIGDGRRLGDEAPTEPPVIVQDDPLVVALAATGFVTSLVVLIVILLN
jgi:hypothetical protein